MTATPSADALTGKDFYLFEFERAEAGLAWKGQDWLCPLRKEAISRFAQMGFPTRRNEQWRHTNLAQLERTPFKFAPPVSLNSEAAARVRALLFDSAEAIQMVFVNGYFAPDLSSPCRASDGLTVSTLAQAVQAQPELARHLLARHARYEDHPFVALNTAFMRDGAFIFVADGRKLESPIHLLFVSTAPGEAVVSHPRNLFIVGDSAQAQIVETYAGLADEAYFTNATTEVVLSRNSRVDHYKVQRESPMAFHLGAVQAFQAQGSRYVSLAISFGAALARNDIASTLGAEGCECILNGLYLGADSQHLDTHTRLDHSAPNCRSRQLYKGILGGQASAVFNGRIHVRPNAQKTDAIQSNQCLLLSEAATINSQPQLEIFADDVKCTHGAAVGQLDEDGVFYLRSRGLAEPQARGLLTFAFANEIVEWIKVAPLRKSLESLIAERYGSGQVPEGAS